MLDADAAREGGRVPTSTSTVGIAPGDGLIARFGAVVVYLAAETSSTDRILGAIEAVADDDHPGAAIAQRLAAVVFAGGSEPPPFGVLAPTSDGIVILLRGPVVAEIQGAEGVRRISGARAFTWVDEIVREPVRRITVTAEEADSPAAHPRTDLRAGVVPGGGFEFRVGVRGGGRSPAADRRDTARPPTAVEPAHTAPAGFNALDPVGDADLPETRATSVPPFTGSEPVRPRPTGPGASGSDHPVQPPPEQSAPSARSEAPTPRPFSQSRSLALHKGPTVPPDDSATRPARPPATDGSTAPGALLFEDTAYPLDRPYVIGRSPMNDESVRNATASPLSVPRDRHVSRVHAYITLERGKVNIRDAGTPAGTFVAAPGADSWTRVGTSPTALPPGWSIRIGEKILTYRVADPNGPTRISE